MVSSGPFVSTRRLCRTHTIEWRRSPEIRRSVNSNNTSHWDDFVRRVNAEANAVTTAERSIYVERSIEPKFKP